MSDDLVKFLQWDSDFFGIRIARVIPTVIDQNALKYIDDWCDSNKIECIYFLANPAHTPSVTLAKGSGFRHVDTRITLSVQASSKISVDEGQSIIIRPASDSDIPELKAIATVSHRDSRFYMDGNFPREKCDALFESWIEKSCSDFADKVFMAEFDGHPAGYVTCRIDEDKSGSIGLLAVAEKFHRRGIGRRLIHAAISWFVDSKIDTIRVTTQERNLQALSFYKRLGFVVLSHQFWLHRWQR